MDGKNSYSKKRYWIMGLIAAVIVIPAVLIVSAWYLTGKGGEGQGAGETDSAQVPMGENDLSEGLLHLDDYFYESFAHWNEHSFYPGFHISEKYLDGELMYCLLEEAGEDGKERMAIYVDGEQTKAIVYPDFTKEENFSFDIPIFLSHTSSYGTFYKADTTGDGREELIYQYAFTGTGFMDGNVRIYDLDTYEEYELEEPIYPMESAVCVEVMYAEPTGDNYMYAACLLTDNKGMTYEGMNMVRVDGDSMDGSHLMDRKEFQYTPDKESNYSYVYWDEEKKRLNSVVGIQLDQTVSDYFGMLSGYYLFEEDTGSFKIAEEIRVEIANAIPEARKLEVMSTVTPFETGEVIQVDMDGDGVTDEIKVDNMPFIRINERCYSEQQIIDFLGIPFAMPDTIECYILDIDTTDGVYELAIYEDGSSGDPITHILRYEKGKLKNLGCFESSISMDEERAKEQIPGDGSVHAGRVLQSLETWGIEGLWQMNESGYLEEVRKDYYEIILTGREADGQPVTLLRDMEAYSEENQKSDTLTFQKGEEITFIGYSGSGWVEFCGKDGRRGWILTSDSEQILLPEGEVSKYEVFQNLLVAG